MTEKILEKTIQLEICEWLNEHKFFFWRSNNLPVSKGFIGGKLQFRSMPKYAPKGLPDICVLHKGIFYGIEVKGIQKYKSWIRISEDQKKFCEDMNYNGGKYFIVNNLENVKGIFAIC